jgi:hypothetical protein
MSTLPHASVLRGLNQLEARDYVVEEATMYIQQNGGDLVALIIVQALLL